MKEKAEKNNSIIWAYILLLIVTSIAYEPMRKNDFVDYDDNKYVTDNTNVMNGLSTKSFLWAWTTDHASNWHPLTWMSHIIDWEFFGNKPFWHHFVNFIFHAANTLLLFFIFQKMTVRIWPALFIAAIFALHPLHVESAAWVAERKDLLSTFWWMFTVISYLKYTKQIGVKWYFLMILSYALGLLSKPMVVTLPFILLLLDYWPLNRIRGLKSDNGISGAGGKGLLYLIVEKLPLFLMAGVSSIITFKIQQAGGSTTMAGELSLGFRISNAGVSYVMYLLKMFYPVGLAVLYPIKEIALWQVFISFLILGIITVFCLYFAKSKPYLVVGWLWYLGMLVPVIGLVQVGAQSMADRYSYLPSVGIFIMIACGSYEILVRLQREKMFVAGSIIIWVVLIICTRNQLGYWRDGVSLYKHTISCTKDNYIIKGNYGKLLMDKGLPHLAIREFKEVLLIEPNDLVANYNLATAYTEMGRHIEAIDMMSKLARDNPDIPNIHMALGLDYLEIEDYNNAIKCFRRVVEISPDDMDAVNNLAISLAKTGETNEALVCFRNILKSHSQNVPAIFNMLLILNSQGKSVEAVEELKDIIKRCPENIVARGELAWLLATSSDEKVRNPHEAIKIATEGCNMTNYSEIRLLDALGAAYAATGRFKEAIIMTEKALNIAAAAQQTGLIKIINRRITLYKNNQIYVEIPSKIE